MTRPFRKYERKFWEGVIIYASIPVLVVLAFNFLAAVGVWLLVIEALLIGGYITFRLYRRYLLRR
jgi:hypothetical protein